MLRHLGPAHSCIVVPLSRETGFVPCLRIRQLPMDETREKRGRFATWSIICVPAVVIPITLPSYNILFFVASLFHCLLLPPRLFSLLVVTLHSEYQLPPPPPPHPHVRLLPSHPAIPNLSPSVLIECFCVFVWFRSFIERSIGRILPEGNCQGGGYGNAILFRLLDFPATCIGVNATFRRPAGRRRRAFLPALECRLMGGEEID